MPVIALSLPHGRLATRFSSRLRGVSSAKEFGDRLRDKGAKRREALERSTSAHLVRSVSARAEATVKDNVDIVRRPSQQLGSHFDGSFKGALSSRHHLRTFLAGCDLVALPALSLIVLRRFSCCCYLTQAWLKRAADRELPRGWRRRRSPRMLVLSVCAVCDMSVSELSWVCAP